MDVCGCVCASLTGCFGGQDGDPRASDKLKGQGVTLLVFCLPWIFFIKINRENEQRRKSSKVNKKKSNTISLLRFFQFVATPFSFLHTQFSYCTTVWQEGCQTEIDTLISLQDASQGEVSTMAVPLICPPAFGPCFYLRVHTAPCLPCQLCPLCLPLTTTR